LKVLEIVSRILPLPLNGLVVLCFFFSFFLLKCNDNTLVSIEGVDLVVGTEMEDEYELGNWFNTDSEQADNTPLTASKSEHIQPQPLAILALLMALLGGILVFLPVKHRNIIQLVLSLIGLISLSAMIWLFRQHYSEFADSGSQSEWMNNVRLRLAMAPALIWALILFALNALLLGTFIYAAQQFSRSEDGVKQKTNAQEA
jgi:hypothetical protein